MKIIIFLLSLSSPSFGGEAELKNADDLFGKALYQEALAVYDKQAASPGEAGLKALYRAAECEGLLFRYGEAAQRFSSVKLPSDPLWRGRFLLLRAELGVQFLARYGYSLPADIRKGAANAAQLTADEWRERIGADYDALWELRSALAARDLKDESYFLDIKDTSLAATPSLWDFAVLRWSEYLLNGGVRNGDGPPPDGMAFAAPGYKADYGGTASPAAKAAALYEDAGSRRGNDRETAAGSWKIKRLKIPFEHGDKVSVADAEKLRTLALSTLIKWSDSLPAPLARAYAAFEAASLLNGKGDYKGAVELCGKAGQLAPRSKPAAECSRLRAGIEMPRLELTAKFAAPPGKKIISVNARNIPAVYFRAYRTAPSELSELAAGGDNGWGGLRYLQQPAVEHFLSGEPDFAWEARMIYPAPFQYLSKEIDSPRLEKGLYVIVASGDGSFVPGSSLLSAAPVNITDVFLLGTSGVKGDPEDFVFDPARPDRRVRADIFNLYAVNALTGLPAGDAVIDTFHTHNWGGWERKTLMTGADGTAFFSSDLRVSCPSNENFSIDPLLSFGGGYAYWNGAHSSGFSVPEPVELFIETDRPVYRPGQTVKYKVTALLRQPRGYRAYDGKSAVRVAARDQNWQELFNKELPFTGLGSAAGSFPVPPGRLLGQYSISAELTAYGRNFSARSFIAVEEYKRPEFETKLGEAASAFKYGEPAKVTGSVKYYFGSPVPGASISYKVSRSRYIPWYAWWWNWFYGGSGSSEVASGKCVTDEKGEFFFKFTPKPESAEYAAYPSTFRVEAEARDAGGRTISDSRSYTAGSKAYLFDITPEAGFFASDRPAAFRARLMDLNDSQAAGSGSYSVFRIEKTPEFAEEGAQWGSFGHTPSLERAFSRAPDGKPVESGLIEFSKAAPTLVKLKPLKEGVYRLRLKAEDPWGGETESWIMLISAGPGAVQPGLVLPPVALFEHASYQPGEMARVLIGAAALKGVKFMEVLAGNFLLSRKVIAGGGVTIAEFKVGPEHRGGFGLRWFGAGDFKVYSAMAEADVPLKDRELSVALDYDKVLKPGQKAVWTLRVRDASGNPVNGEGTVRIFDRSLEYYQKDAGFWTDSLYEKRRSASDGRSSLFTPGSVSLPVRKGLIKTMFDAFYQAVREERLPGFRVNSSGAGAVRGGGMFKSKGLMRAMSEDSAAPAAVLAGAALDGGAVMQTKMALGAPAPAAAPAPAGAPVQARKDFSETAYFNPQLKMKNGLGRFSFTIPERLTSWKISSYLLTADVKRGKMSAEAVTRKELMVRLDIPRFFREGDRSVLTAVVGNESGLELSGTVSLSVSLDGAPAESKFALKHLSRPFTVKAGGTVPLYWEIAAPSGSAAYKVRAVARAGALSDAQENDLPVLPSRVRLVASLTASLDGKVSTELKLKELEEKDDTRRVESMHLEIQPQLILTVLNSLPFLVHYPFECTEQVLNRYVPLAITNSFYRRYPELKKAVAKLPKRTTLTPAWERDNPVRQMALMETPWEEASKGAKSYWPGIDMLDPGVVAAEGKDALGKLTASQNADGSFPWFPGGRPDAYMTLYALNGFAEAARYNVPVPENAVRKALNYVFSEIPAHMKAEEAETSFILYAAYVVTSFPQKWPEYATALPYAKAWVDFADKHSSAMTALGMAYAAYVYQRLGEPKKAESYLARAMDGAREDAAAGVYWMPEKLSWLWYNDTVEKHAFLLRTLLALKPKDPRIPGMVKWLLFNRKANEWGSTKASAAAIYSLLDVMKSKGPLDKEEVFKIKWADTTDEVALKPFDWPAKPLRWSKYAPGIGGREVSAAIEKTGPGLAYASLTGVYTTDKTADESPSGMMNISRRYFLRAKEGENYVLKPLAAGDAAAVGDQIEVQLTITCRSQFEYVHLKDPRGAGFEAEELKSGWKWEQLARYEEPRDSVTNFFVGWLPHGEYVLKYRVRPTTPGTYKIGAAAIQSMYAPEFAAHSSGMTLTVR